jgi:shikimate dehydrogenase
VVVNRSEEPARVAAALGGEHARVGTVDDVVRADLVVNATPIGMHGPGAGLLPCPESVLHAGQTVVDLVYDPLETPLLTAAQAGGAAAYNGLSMLVFQAARAFEIWTGRDAPVEAMLGAAAGALQSRPQH